jgi:Ca2+:H+ antiporter
MNWLLVFIPIGLGLHWFGALEPASESLNLTPRFAGALLLSLVATPPRWPARSDSRGRTRWTSASTSRWAGVQVGLLFAPVLVFLGLIMGQNLDLIFSPLELIEIVMAIYLTRNLTYDGELDWLEGLMLVAVYVMFGISFCDHPGTENSNRLANPPAALSQP